MFAFAVVHELPSAAVFFQEAARCLRPGACLLLVEPAGHVSTTDFASELELAMKANLHVIDRPAMRKSHAALCRLTRDNMSCA